jgi:hypothetical protein
MLPTETDFDGRRVVRNIAEYTHLADHVALASTVHHLAHAIDRVRTELEEAAYDDAKPDEDVFTIRMGSSGVANSASCGSSCNRLMASRSSSCWTTLSSTSRLSCSGPSSGT